MADQPPPVHRLLARSAKLRLFLMLRRTRDGTELRRRLDAHLGWVIGLERQGRVFLSGPVKPEGGAVALDGLTVLRAPDMQAAHSIAMSDPFVQAGAVTFELREWTVNEGAISVSVSLSDSTASFS